MELQIVLLLITFIILFSKFNVSLNLAKPETEKLYTILCYLRQRAITSGYKKYLYFKKDAYFFENNYEKLENGVKFGILDKVKSPPSLNKEEAKKAITFKKNRIIFYPNGTISPGIVCLVDSIKKNMYCISIGIAKASFIRKYKFFNGNWIRI